MALPVLLLGVLLVEPALAPVPLGVDVPPLAAPPPVAPDAPDAPLPALPAPALPAPSDPSPPGVVPVPVAPAEPDAEPVPLPVPDPVLEPEDPGEVFPMPPTELDVPDALAPSLRLCVPIVGVPGAPVPAPGAVEPDGDPIGGVGPVLRSQAINAAADSAMSGTASHCRAADGRALRRCVMAVDR